jgi:large subunit ribosomal protein L7A
MLEDLKKASKRTVGMKQTLKAVQSGTALRVFLAKDVDDYVSQKVKDQCHSHSVDIIMVDSMDELGKACGIAVGAATAAILR